jgi:hypothetical protein
MLKIRGSRVRSLQLMQFFDFVQDTCPWFPEEGTVNLETWNKVGHGLRMCYTAEGPECMPIFTFSLWYMIRDVWIPLSHMNKDFPPQYLSWDVGYTLCNQSYRIVRGSIP